MNKIHHIALQFDNVKSALGWNQKQFDIDVIYQVATWAMLKFENISLAVVIAGQHPPHLAVQYEDAEKYGDLTPHHDGAASIYIDEPFGYVIEIIKT